MITLTLGCHYGIRRSMQLTEYLRAHGLTHKEFAERIGAQQPTVTRYANGKRFPLRKHLIRIREATGGAVTADDFLSIETAA